MKIKKLLAAVLVFALCAAFFAACAKNDEPTTASTASEPTTETYESVKMNIGCISGPTGIGMAYLMGQSDEKKTANEYTFSVATSPDEIVSRFANVATAGVGTALGVIRSLHKRGLIRMVYADETRPLLQGARLTVSELMADGIPVTLITDNMAAWVMKTKGVDAVIVGADRITANGDTANKIGTYGVSILAKEHGVPFYVAAPISTFDLSLDKGEQIPIEERNHDEVRSVQGVPTALPEAAVFNPAFDVTPHENIAAIFTEKGVIRKPDDGQVYAFFNT